MTGQANAIAVDRNADVPVGVQLEWALSAQIRDGRYEAGQQLPTLRELAEATGLNVNTVRSVYGRLEQKRLVDTHQGSGTFVAAAPGRAPALSSIAANAAHEAFETGLDPRDVAAALYVTPDDSREPGHAETAASRERLVAERRRALRGQIATLERTVAELEAEHPGVAPAPARSRRGIGPALLTAEELARVRAELIRRLTVVHAAIDANVERQLERTAPRKRAPAPARTTRKAKAKDKAKAKAKTTPARPPRARATTRPAPASG
jgi:DNA-binding transcriptional regulator YhcF (GntR family)